MLAFPRISKPGHDDTSGQLPAQTALGLARLSLKTSPARGAAALRRLSRPARQACLTLPGLAALGRAAILPWAVTAEHASAVEDRESPAFAGVPGSAAFPTHNATHILPLARAIRQCGACSRARWRSLPAAPDRPRLRAGTISAGNHDSAHANARHPAGKLVDLARADHARKCGSRPSGTLPKPRPHAPPRARPRRASPAQPPPSCRGSHARPARSAAALIALQSGACEFRGSLENTPPIATDFMANRQFARPPPCPGHEATQPQAPAWPGASSPAAFARPHVRGQHLQWEKTIWRRTKRGHRGPEMTIRPGPAVCPSRMQFQPYHVSATAIRVLRFFPGSQFQKFPPQNLVRVAA